MIELYPHQKAALDKLKVGAVLLGDVGSGKTLTGLSFYLKKFNKKQLYVITTAKKRDSLDWENEANLLGITEIVVDSWNNISEYKDVTDAFFIFDEQRVVGYGTWAKYFINITKHNPWIMLTATPGDVWFDYLAIFIANGFYRNKTDFINQHVEYNRFIKYPVVKAYHNEGKLLQLRRRILVPMPVVRATVRNDHFILCKFDKEEYDTMVKKRWNPYTDEPFRNASEMIQALRRSVGSNQDRINTTAFLLDTTDKVIVFYNYIYEIDILKRIAKESGKPYAQWNGQAHEPIPDSDQWIYLVQYTSGAEGWNCIETDTILFYSLNYSYRVMEQAKGRIDRINTKFVNLNYFHMVSNSGLDNSIRKSITEKRIFNESGWVSQ